MSSIDILVPSVKSTGAIIENRFVTAAGAQTAANGNALGVAQYGVSAAGQMVPVTSVGVVGIEAGGAVSVGQPVASDSSGRAVYRDGATYTVTLGRALTASTAAGQLLQVHLIPN